MNAQWMSSERGKMAELATSFYVANLAPPSSALLRIIFKQSQLLQQEIAFDLSIYTPISHKN